VKPVRQAAAPTSCGLEMNRGRCPSCRSASGWRAASRSRARSSSL